MVGFPIYLHTLSLQQKVSISGAPKKNQRPLVAQARKDAIKPALAFFTGLGGRNLVGPGGPGGE